MKTHKFENGQNTKTSKWSKRKNVRTEKKRNKTLCKYVKTVKTQECEKGQNANIIKWSKLKMGKLIFFF